MCVYKLVKTSFKYWGVQDKVEALMQKKGFGETFYKMHRPMLPWMTEWCPPPPPQPSIAAVPG
jgi:hypothetical protein